MEEVHVTSRKAWRAWLTRCHDTTPRGIWLVFHKKETGKPVLSYDDAVEEALCFGWIDATIRKIDEERYARRFTPRRPHSRWSDLNKKRVAGMIACGKMTEHGLARIEVAKRSGEWDLDPRPHLKAGIPPELEAALRKNERARQYFDALAPSYRMQYIGWISSAKRPETSARRVAESIDLLRRGQKLGMK